MINKEAKVISRTRRSCINWWLLSSKCIKNTTSYILLKEETSQGQQKATSDNVGKENLGCLRHSCLGIDHDSPGGWNQVPRNHSLDSCQALSPGSDRLALSEKYTELKFHYPFFGASEKSWISSTAYRLCLSLMWL